MDFSLLPPIYSYFSTSTRSITLGSLIKASILGLISLLNNSCILISPSYSNCSRSRKTFFQIDLLLCSKSTHFLSAITCLSTSPALSLSTTNNSSQGQCLLMSWRIERVWGVLLCLNFLLLFTDSDREEDSREVRRYQRKSLKRFDLDRMCTLGFINIMSSSV